jgi:hypothetical protein
MVGHLSNPHEKLFFVYVNDVERVGVLCEVPHVWHQHVVTELFYQRFFAILAAARTQVAREPHHAVGPVGERWRSGDHFTKRDDLDCNCPDSSAR